MGSSDGLLELFEFLQAALCKIGGSGVVYVVLLLSRLLRILYILLEKYCANLFGNSLWDIFVGR